MSLLRIDLTLCFLLFAVGTACAEPVDRVFGSLKLRLDPIFYDSFDHDLSHWQVEGKAQVTIRQGFLEVDTIQPPNNAATIWHTGTYSGPQVVEYDVRLMPDSMESNINMFLLAAAPDVPGKIGTGRYKDYQDFPNYLVTILNTTSPQRRQMLRVRMRLNPGFELVRESWLAPLDFGHVYHVAYVIQPPKVSVYLDDNLICETVYKRQLDKGFHALRIWRTHSIYDNFQISRIVE